MIEKKEYLEALQIVEEYHKQIKSGTKTKTLAEEWVKDLECSYKLKAAIMHRIGKKYVEDITPFDILDLRSIGITVLREFEQFKALTIGNK